ncbi:hypothetical protein BDQ17DRAFT_1330962 [Cyathus striatus]|nr:hypothetical protein BDQ17DRAFT_1330962 [Cyathus striatus]
MALKLGPAIVFQKAYNGLKVNHFCEQEVDEVVLHSQAYASAIWRVDKLWLNHKEGLMMREHGRIGDDNLELEQVQSGGIGDNIVDLKLQSTYKVRLQSTYNAKDYDKDKEWGKMMRNGSGGNIQLSDENITLSYGFEKAKFSILDSNPDSVTVINRLMA